MDCIWSTSKIPTDSLYKSWAHTREITLIHPPKDNISTKLYILWCIMVSLNEKIDRWNWVKFMSVKNAICCLCQWVNLHDSSSLLFHITLSWLGSSMLKKCHSIFNIQCSTESSVQFAQPNDGNTVQKHFLKSHVVKYIKATNKSLFIMSNP